MKTWGCDFLLVTAVPVEFSSKIRRVFGAERIPKGIEDSRNYYKSALTTKFGRKYDLRLFSVGRKGGQNTASAVKTAVEKYHPKFVIMFGIAACQPGGGRGKGDFLVSEVIADVEEIKKGKVDLPRPSFFECERVLVDHIKEHFSAKRGKNAVHTGVIISQVNLSRSSKYRDSLVEHVTKSLGRNDVIGLEMEGGGLAKTIQDLPIDMRPGFVLLKGAVDWGNYHKNSAMQERTAVGVARFVLKFLGSEPAAPLDSGEIQGLTSAQVNLHQSSQLKENLVSFSCGFDALSAQVKSLRLNVMIWGPSPSTDSPLARKSKALTLALRDAGHDAKCSEDFPTSGLPIKQERHLQARLADVVVALCPDGVMEEIEEDCSQITHKMLVWCPTAAKRENQSSSLLGRIAKLNPSQVRFFSDRDLQECNVVKGTIEYVLYTRFHKWYREHPLT